jgi:hypothetical protein
MNIRLYNMLSMEKNAADALTRALRYKQTHEKTVQNIQNQLDNVLKHNKPGKEKVQAMLNEQLQNANSKLQKAENTIKSHSADTVSSAEKHLENVGVNNQSKSMRELNHAEASAKDVIARAREARSKIPTNESDIWEGASILDKIRGAFSKKYKNKYISDVNARNINRIQELEDSHSLGNVFLESAKKERDDALGAIRQTDYVKARAAKKAKSQQAQQPIVQQAQPTVQQPTVQQPTVQQAQPTVQQPIVQQAQPTVQQPIVQQAQPTIQQAQPTVQQAQPTVQQPIVQAQPTVQQPIVQAQPILSQVAPVQSAANNPNKSYMWPVLGATGAASLGGYALYNHKKQNDS